MSLIGPVPCCLQDAVFEPEKAEAERHSDPKDGSKAIVDCLVGWLIHHPGALKGRKVKHRFL